MIWLSSSVEAEKKFVGDIAKLDKTSFDIVTGLRAGAFVVVPLLFAPLSGYTGAAFAALGGMWLTNTESPKSKTSIRVLLVACLTESAAVGLGTLAGSHRFILPILAGAGIFLSMLLHGNPKWTRVGTFTAITFAVGVGLPGLPYAAVGRAFYSLVGTTLALLGIALQRAFVERKIANKGEQLPSEKSFHFHPDAIRNALMIGIASALGFWIGIVLGLPRDFWVAVTIILTVQPSLNSTLEFTLRMVLGTFAGAVIGSLVILGWNDFYFQLAILSIFAVIMFAVRGVNIGLVQIFLAPFIIILLDLVYGGKANFAEARVIDVSIGGLISILTVFFLSQKMIRKFWKSLS